MGLLQKQHYGCFYLLLADQDKVVQKVPHDLLGQLEGDPGGQPLGKSLHAGFDVGTSPAGS